MYAKTIYVYSKQERNQFHRRGIWIDRNGYQTRICDMSFTRLASLVKTLGTWALKEENPRQYLKSLAIYPHVLARMYELGLNTTYSYLFLYPKMEPEYDPYWNLYVQPPTPEELVAMDQEAT